MGDKALLMLRAFEKAGSRKGDLLICEQYGLPHCGKPEPNCNAECAVYEPTCTCNTGKWNQCVRMPYCEAARKASGTYAAGCYGGFKPRVERKATAAAGKGE